MIWCGLSKFAKDFPVIVAVACYPQKENFTKLKKSALLKHLTPMNI